MSFYFIVLDAKCHKIRKKEGNLQRHIKKTI